MNDLRYPIPKDWKWIMLDQVLIRYQLGVAISTTGKENIFIVKPSNIANGSVHMSHLKKVTIAYQDKEKMLLKKGDILVSWAHSYENVGKAGLYEGDKDAIFSPSLFRLQVNRQMVFPGYLSLWLNAETVKRFLLRINPKGIGATKMDIKTYVKFCPVLLPPLEKQGYIAKVLSTWNATLSLLEDQIIALRKQKKGVIQRLLIDLS